MRFIPHDYQKKAIDWVIDKKRCALFLQMGLGKSVITLTAIQYLIDDLEISKVLVIAPKKVAESTWTDEVEKWEHLNLRVSKVIGTEKKRIEALAAKADVYVLGRDSYVWLCGYYDGELPFDMLVIDELTTFKSSNSQRFKMLKKTTAQFKRVVGLTGTPAPNGLIDLWAQIYVIDMGERLGKYFTHYRRDYFNYHIWNNIAINCTIKKGAEEVLNKKLSDICLTMQSKDYIKLPKLITHTEIIPLPDKIKKKYDDFEKDSVIEFQKEHSDDSETILASSIAALMNKLSQFANGAIYDEDRNVYEIHNEKLEKLKEIVEAAQSPVLCFYQYQHDIPRITEALKGYKVVKYETAEHLKQWNKGEIDVLLAHPASTAFGLNMQQGGHYIVWFSTGWNLELYQQANARLYRQGQTQPVFVYKLVCQGTVDERMNVSLTDKKSVQQGLMDSLSDLVKKYDKGKA
ncbi:MAG: DEAD/DEAH box helicase [Prevotella sp.]|nr:DEAD/DEAH box helicase [Prevotella sp.]